MFRSQVLWLASALVLAALPAVARAQSLLDTQPWGFMTPSPADAKMEKVAAEGKPGGATEAIRVTVTKASDPFYLIMLMKEVPVEVPDGSRLRLRFWARSATRNPLRAVVEQAGPPYTAAINQSPTLTPEWQQYTGTGIAPGWPARGCGVRLQMGHQPGVVDIAGVTLENLGPDPSSTAAKAAIEPAAVKKRIEQVRKADLAITVTRRGRPVPMARVQVEMKRHAFLFGCNIFGLNPADGGDLQRAYQDRYLALFNYATLPFYWGAFEPKQGEPQNDRLMAMARWCSERGLAAKGHPLVWHEVWPGWAPTDVDQSMSLLRARILDLIPRYKALVRYWDVQNEATASAQYPKTGVGQWAKRDGASAMVATTLGWARDAAKGLGDTLLYNDYDTGDSNVALLTELRKRGALPDAIGIQSHMHGQPWKLEQVWAVAERFSQFGKPIHFTETTVISGDIRPFSMANPPSDWVTTPAGEARQADYVERFYSILFSHPSIEAITWWDFSDASAWLNAPAGFLRKDMSPKPAYDRLMKLIHHDWWTTADGEAGADGTYKVRAFQGDYEVVVTAPDGAKTKVSFQIPIGAKSKRVAVKLP